MLLWALSLLSLLSLPGVHNLLFHRRENRDLDREHNRPEIPQLTVDAASLSALRPLWPLPFPLQSPLPGKLVSKRHRQNPKNLRPF